MNQIRKIENYSLMEVIGEGNYGKVYKSVNRNNNQTVAIKVVPRRQFLQHPQLQKTTIEQIKVLSKITDNTHIVRYIQLLNSPNNCYFVYQFCNGGTLAKAIKSEGKFPQPKALLYFKQLLSAFKVLNNHKIMHRDLKPENIYLHDGILKVGDFGFCKALAGEDLAQTMLGSPLYMAPEVLKHQIYTSKADVWSLGVVLYEMLFGHCPFESANIYNLIITIDSTDFKIPPNTVSKECEGLLRKMLVKDQFQRIDWGVLLNTTISEDGRIVVQANRVSGSFEKQKSQSSIRYSPSDPWKQQNPSEPIVRSIKSSDSSNLKKLSSPQLHISHRKFLEDHQKCMKATMIALNFIREMHKLGLPFAYIIIQAIESRLQRLHNESKEFKTAEELVEVRKNLNDIEKELSTYEKDMIKAPKNFLRYRFRGEQESQLALWVQMVGFLKGDGQVPVLRQEMIAYVKSFLA